MPRERRLGWVAVMLAIAVAACGPSREAGFDRSPEAGEAGSLERLRDCGPIVDDDEAGLAELADMDLVPALEAVPELSHVASAMQGPRMAEQLERFEHVTLFAPIDDAQRPDGVESNTVEDLATPPPEAYVHPDGALQLDELLEQAVVDVADGGSLSIALEDDVVVVERDGVRAHVVCADLQVRNGVVHLLDAVPYEPDTEELQPDDETDRDELRPDIDDQLDDLQDDDTGI